MAERLLPLFPLSVVLLPHTALPLHIFEDRYKEMIGDVISAKSEFGVVLVKDEGIVSIGCTATVHRVLQRYPDGRMDLLAVGQRRFQVLSLDEEKPYLRATVEFLVDEGPENVPRELKLRALSDYQRLREIEKQEVDAEPTLEAKDLSFQLAHFISDVDKRQMVLSLQSELERLKFLVSIIPEYLAQRERQILARRVAPLNGHAKHVPIV